MGAHRKLSPARNRLRNVALGGAAATLTVAATSGAAGAAQAPTINWDPIIHCESGGNPTAHNASSTASGLYQFLTSSWLAYGGGRYAPTAAQATAAQQTDIANAAYAASGLTPWAASQACWGPHTADILNGAPAVAAPLAELVLPAPPGRHASNQPAPAPAKPTPPKHAAPDPAASGQVHVVVPGDTLWDIAPGHDWTPLYQRNRDVVGPNPDYILPGEHLTL